MQKQEMNLTVYKQALPNARFIQQGELVRVKIQGHSLLFNAYGSKVLGVDTYSGAERISQILTNLQIPFKVTWATAKAP